MIRTPRISMRAVLVASALLPASGLAWGQPGPRVSGTGGGGGGGAATSLATTTAGVPRWSVLQSAEPETGANNGSNLTFYRYSDAGVFISTPLYIDRASGLVNAALFTSNSASFGSVYTAGQTNIEGALYIKGAIISDGGSSVSFGSLVLAGSGATVSGGLTADVYKSGAATGVSCAAGTVTLATMVVTNGIVTHC